jgi:dipeptidase E
MAGWWHADAVGCGTISAVRLYLSSFRLGDHPEHLLRLAGDGARAAVVANSIDGAPADIRREGVARELDDLTGLGLRPHELDLRELAGPDAVEAALDGVDAVWVRGGNTFVLRVALARSGADAVLADAIRRDALVYAGYSAGGCVLAPSLRGLELVDPVEDVGRVWPGAGVVWEGLGVLDRAFVPHWSSPGHPETELIDDVVALYDADGTPYRKLRDGQVLVADGDSVTVL